MDFTIPSLFQRDPASIWENAVPIIRYDDTTHAYLNTEIMEPDQYNELCFRLATATNLDKFVLYINTPGGLIDSAFMLCDAIKNSPAHVTAKLTGTVASAGTIITMVCDDIIVSDHLSFMIHNYSAGVSGKGHEMKARQGFMDSSLNDAFREFYTDFLTPSEMQEIIDGKDLWIGSDEVRTRWARRGTVVPPIADVTPRRGRPRKA